ncbi:MAG: hypothetical protein PHW32_02435 [Bacilli bacterium]|nr:hypothetical protein [Bacilli bacterium]MDD4282508.1 hypothetical protein [Bacilli bacterium]
MNRLEFKNVMDVLGIDNKVSNIKGRYGSTEDVHSWNDFKIYFYGSYYSVVEGKIPLEVAKIIYDKYPNNPYSIRVAGGADDNKPSDWAKSEEYNKFVNAAFEVFKEDCNYFNKYKAVINNKKQKILEKDPESLYIDMYHIDTKEGLLILITELQDYFIRKILNNPNIKGQVVMQSKLLAEVNRRLIKQSNPYLSTNQWIKEQDIMILEKTKNRQSDDEQENKIRCLLNKFDEIINPFTNDEIEMLDPNNYTDKITFNCYGDENEINLTVIDKKTKFWAEHKRSEKFMTYGLYYGKKPRIHIHHYFDAKDENLRSPVEVICLSHSYDKFNDKREIDLRYDLTNGLTYKTYANEEEKQSITPEQKTLIINELQKAIQTAELITINNMSKPKEQKTIKKTVY